MKSIATIAALLLLFTGCASNDGFADQGLDNCAPGDELELQAGVGQASMFADGRATVMVEVSNNSDADLTVDMVRVDPRSPDTSRYDVMGGAVTTPQEIKEGESHTFEVPINLRIKDQMAASRQRGYAIQIEADVSVRTTSGIATRCRFALPVQF